jgi:chromate transporter
MADSTALAANGKVSHAELFITFLIISMSSIGGGLQAWVHRILVERKRWLSEAEFVDMIGLCQLLPGPNVVNASIYTGERLRGAVGALSALLGLMLVPLALIMVLGYGIVSYGDNAMVQGALHGMSVMAAGFTASIAVRLTFQHDRRWFGIVVSVVAFVTLGLLQWPLLWVVGLLGPASYAAAWYQQRRRR